MLLKALVFLPVLAAGFTSTGPSGEEHARHLPLKRRTPHRRGEVVDVDHLVRSRDSLRAKYGLSVPYNSDLGRRSGVSDIGTLNQNHDIAYLASIEVGTPPQSLDIQLDTGSADLWFATTSFTNFIGGKFDVSRSSSVTAVSSESGELRYNSGNVFGTLFQDTVTLGPFTVPNQTFVGVTRVDTGVVFGSTAGLLGLAFQGISATASTPFWQALINAGVLDAPEMSFQLTRSNAAEKLTEFSPGGTFTLGGTDSSLYKGDIDFRPFPVGRQLGSWLQTVTGLTVNGNPVDIGTDEENIAIIDTGATLIGGPTKAVQAFWAQVDGSQEIVSGSRTGYYRYPCTTNITATLSFGGGTAWPIAAGDMNFAVSEASPSLCIGAIYDLQKAPWPNPDGPGIWSIGDAFLKNVYTVFRAGDSPAVGFAELADDPNPPPIHPSTTAPIASASSMLFPITTPATLTDSTVPSFISSFAVPAAGSAETTLAGPSATSSSPTSPGVTSTSIALIPSAPIASATVISTTPSAGSSSSAGVRTVNGVAASFGIFVLGVMVLLMLR